MHSRLYIKCNISYMYVGYKYMVYINDSARNGNFIYNYHPILYTIITPILPRFLTCEWISFNIF